MFLCQDYKSDNENWCSSLLNDITLITLYLPIKKNPFRDSLSFFFFYARVCQDMSETASCTASFNNGDLC